VDIIEGQGTLGYEIYKKLPDVDTVVVNVGGGGMIAGIALYLKRVNPKIRIIGVQSERVSPLAQFKETSELRYVEPNTTTLADGTNVKLPGGVHTKVLHDLVDEYVTVSENEIAAAIVRLLTTSRTLSEGAGCLGLAALLHKKIKVRPDEKVCVVMCGGNIDISTLRQVYEYGLQDLGRVFSVRIKTSDSPGNLSSLINLATKSELIIRSIHHVRGGGNINWSEVVIAFSFYSNSFRHQIQFLMSVVENLGLFPKIVGRKYMPNHEKIYADFDEACIRKQKAMSDAFTKREIEFKNKYRSTYKVVEDNFSLDEHFVPNSFIPSTNNTTSTTSNGTTH